MRDFRAVRRLLAEAPGLGVAPRVDAAVHADGELVALSSHPDLPEARFDLASLTKPLATGLVALSLVADGRTELDSPVGRGCSLRQVLDHTAGFEAWAPLFLPLLDDPTTAALFAPDRPDDARALFRLSRARLAAQAAHLEPARAAGERTVYSDLGFLRLQQSIEDLEGEPLDQIFERRVRGPLGLSLGFTDLALALPPSGQAGAEPTGDQRPRPPAPGQESLLPPGTARRTGLRPGEVDDDTAYALGGVAGHAGLFGTARAVAEAGAAFLRDCEGERRLAPPELAVAFCGERSAERGLGWDRAAPAGSLGQRLGRGPKGAVGHLGFTGCSVWVDLDRRASVALCTNRVALGRSNQLVRDFRPRFHDLVADALGLT